MTSKHIRAQILSRPDFVSGFAPAETVARRHGLPLDSIVKLDANENLYGPSPKVQAALAGFSAWNLYPDPDYEALNEALAKYAGVKPEQIVAANGGDEAILLVTRLLVERGREVINCPPTFSVFADAGFLQGGHMVDVPRLREQNYAVDVPAVLRAITDKTSLIFLCNPNNPSGGLTPQADIKTLLDTGVMVMVDETYLEFCGATVVSWLDKYPNLLIVRSLSKWAGLAALRIGYGIFHPETARQMRKVRELFNVNQAACLAAVASLNDTQYLHANVAKLVSERERMFGLLSALPFLHCYPSSCNFILCDVAGADASQLREDLERQGIIVRSFQNRYLPNALRISVGKPEHTDRLLQALHSAAQRFHLL